MVGLQDLTIGCGESLKGAVPSDWHEQSKTRRTELSVDNDWGSSSNIPSIDARTNEALPDEESMEHLKENKRNGALAIFNRMALNPIEQESYQEGFLSVPSIGHATDSEPNEEAAAFLVEGTRPPQQISESLRTYKRNGILRQAIDYLRKFRESLETPEAAMHIHLAKEKLAESWQFIAEEDKVIRLIIPALEGAVRQRKWRNYKSHQIETIQNILEECIAGKLHGSNDVLKRISMLYKQDIDIFPSAPEEAYEEDNETETGMVP